MIELNYRDARPIHEQIKESIRRLILSGVIKEDEKLPSVRELATQMAINPNTIQRAYRELELEGVIYVVAGKGSFAAPTALAGAGRKKELLEQFDAVVDELLCMNYSPDKLRNHLEELIKGGADK